MEADANGASFLIETDRYGASFLIETAANAARASMETRAAAAGYRAAAVASRERMRTGKVVEAGRAAFGGGASSVPHSERSRKGLCHGIARVSR